MARIKTVRPLVRTLKPRMSAPKGEKARLKERDETQPWRRWYYTAQWQKLRQKVWERDQYTCRRTGTLCIGKYPAGNSPVANHIIPHKGDQALFWDRSNWQTLCRSHHSAKTARENAGGDGSHSGPVRF